MQTIADVRDELVAVFNGLRNGTIEPKDAVEINNTAGKIISSLKVQIAYHALRQEVPDIAFLGAPSQETAGRLPSLPESQPKLTATATGSV